MYRGKFSYKTHLFLCREQKMNKTIDMFTIIGYNRHTAQTNSFLNLMN